MRAWLAVVAVLGACGDEIRIHPDAIVADGSVDGSDGGDGMVAQMIGPGGGTVMAPGLEVVIPPGAVTSDQLITITTTSGAPAGYAAQSAIYHLEPEGLVFTQPVSITLELTSVAARTRVFWSKLQDPGFDDRGGTISGTTITATNTHFSDVFAGLLPVELVIDPTSVDFGQTLVGLTSTVQTFEIDNVGMDETESLAATISGANAAEFAITQSTCTTLDTDESCTVAVRCAPTSHGTKTATLTVGDTTYSVSSSLNCTGHIASDNYVSPSLAEFGSVVVGSSSTASFTFTNPGSSATGILSSSKSGANPDQFTIANDTCSGVSVPGFSTCSFDVHFSPTDLGAKAASIHFTTASSASVSLPVTGTGVAPAQLDVTPAMHDFGVINVGTTRTRTVTVQNTGGVATAPLALALDGNPELSIQSDTCTGVALAPNATCTFVVQFFPSNNGTFTGTVTVSGGSGITDAFVVFGQAASIQGITVSPSVIDFGSFLVGETSPMQTFTIRNQGVDPTGPVTTSQIGSNPAELVIVNDTCAGSVVNPGESCTIDVAFAPTSRGVKTASVIVAATPGGTLSLPMTGTGLAPAQLVVAPTSQDFGTVGAGGTGAPTTLTFTNAGDAPTGALGGIVLAGSQTEIVVVTNGCAAITLAGGESCEVVVRYTPTFVGAFTGTLSISSTIGGTAEVALTGMGATPAGLSITPTPNDFGAHVVGSPSAPASFTVVNTGGVSTATLATSIGGGNFEDFEITSDSCAGVQLASGAFCQLSIVFTPTGTGARTARLDITGAGAASAALTGTGLSPAQIVATPTSVVYGTVAIGSTVMLAVQVSNTGEAPSGAIAASIGGVDPSQFSLGADGCTGVPLAPSESCTLLVSFVPTSTGAKSAELQLDATPGGRVAVPTSGSGAFPAQLQISPGSTDFGNVVVGQASIPVTFTVTNTGGIPSGVIAKALAAPDASQFSIEPATTCNTNPLAPGATCAIVVRFRPTSTGTKSSGVSISATPGGGATALASGTGLSPAALSIAPPSADFGTVVVGETSGPVAFTVTNTGGVTSGVVDGVFLPPDGSQFIVDVGATTCGVTLAPGASCVTTVRFVPTSTGAKTSTGRVSATPGGSVDVALSGTAVGSALLSMAPASRDFGPITVGQTSVPTTFTITNIGGSATGSLMPAMLGNDPDQFAVDVAASSCLFITLAPNASCDVVIRFAPTSAGAKSASASLTADPGGNVTAALAGTGL